MNTTAIHEAGHMSVAQSAGWTVIHVTASDDGEGATTFAPVEDPRTDDILDVLAAGAAAELAADILVFSTWKRFRARAQVVAKTLDAGAVIALANSI